MGDASHPGACRTPRRIEVCGLRPHLDEDVLGDFLSKSWIAQNVERHAVDERCQCVVELGKGMRIPRRRRNEQVVKPS